MKSKALYTDIRRTYVLLEGGKAKKVIGCLRSPGVQAVAVYRFGGWIWTCPVPLRVILTPIYIILNGFIKMAWGIELPRGAKIGRGFYIGHFGSITVSSLAVIGENCNLSHGVTIGASGHGENRGVPTIGDQVFIGPGAKLFGKIKIGNHVKIGPNAVVHTDIPDKAVVVLEPGYTIKSYNGNINI